MNHNIDVYASYAVILLPYAVILPIAIILTGWSLVVVLCRYVEISTGKAVLISLFLLMASVAASLIRLHQREISTPCAPGLAAMFAGLLTALAVVFLIQLHSKWIAGRLTDAEKKPGMEGVRAWLGAGNIIVVVLISLLAWLSFDYSPFGVAVLGLLALLAYPMMKSTSVHLEEPRMSNAAERQRVLNMLDSGKITAAEGAELLSALSLSEKPRASKTAATTPPQKLALIGALLLLIGFFLPWITINPKTELERAAQKLPIDPSWTQHFPWGMSPATDPIRFVGGDVPHGLGWLILFLGLAAAASPYLAGNLPEQTRQRATLAGLGVGAVILLYLMTNNLRFVSIGILLAVIGYGLQFAGALQKERFGSHAAE